VELSCSPEAHRSALRTWAEDLCATMPEISGVAALRAKPGTNKQQERVLSTGATHLTYQTQRAAYRVSVGSFFQTNRHLTDELVRVVTGGRSGDLALDLYAGMGLFSTALACDFHHIVSVESSHLSSADLAYNEPSNGEAVHATAEQYLARPEHSRRAGKGIVLPHTVRTPDLVIVDPPRSGLGERVTRPLAKMGAPSMVYVSCDPATLARDLAHLLAVGYHLEQVHLVDLFPQTFHVESVVCLAR